jgi:glucan phosphoethanolaminetransferase (alkaline phosphatase superfamily)
MCLLLALTLVISLLLGYRAKPIDLVFFGLGFILSNRYLLARFALFGLLLLIGLYGVAGAVHGSPHSGFIAAMIETNSAESLEFFQSLGSYPYVLILTLFALAVTLWQWTRVVRLSIPKAATAKWGSAAVLLLALLVGSDTRYTTLGHYMPMPVLFARDTVRSVQTYLHFRSEFTKAMASKYGFDNVRASPRYQDYVVVLGESVRKDYMSVYGYPLATTPFLDQVPGLFLDNFYSASGNTIESLTRMLTFNEEGASANLLRLASEAGFHVTWLSNQGYMGRFDSSVSLLSVSAHEVRFSNSGEFNKGVHTDDVLYPWLEDALAQESAHRLIFMHLMGSHPDFCERLASGEPVFELRNREMDCYLSTILQTDQLLESVYQRLQKTGRSFSLLYVADHGLHHVSRPFGGGGLTHGHTRIANFQVPLVILSSDATAQTKSANAYSGLEFSHGLAGWLGITEDKIVRSIPFGVARTDAVAVYSAQQGKRIHIAELQDDPAQIFERRH